MGAKKTAVILFNLGGPDKLESIKPFLFNFFMDKNIIRAPLFVRFCLAKLISIRRSKCEAGGSYKELGNKSPLLENSTKQAKALESLLNSQNKGEFKTFISMRYWYPMAPEVARKVKDYTPDHIVLLPLYPQFSTTTTKSSFQSWDKAVSEINLETPTTKICCYPWEDGFVKSSADNILKIYEQAKQETEKEPRILFSAHGLPENIIKYGDPYQWQCEQSAAKIIESIELKNLDWQICYQSRVGRLKWIGPSTGEALQKAAADNVPVIIYPHAFTQEHVETLVEIEIEYRKQAKNMGVPAFYTIPTVGTSQAFIEGLADLACRAVEDKKLCSHEGKRLCPHSFKECAMS